MEIFGRDESFRLLEEATAAARAGRGALVVVRADPGMGITALLDAHCAAARDSGMRTHRLPVLVPSGRTPLSTGPVSWDEPALVVLDDLHRADDDTLLALHELAEQVGDRSLLILAGRHRGATPERFAVLDRSATTHDLEPLDAAAVRAMTGAEVAEAGGNPWLLSRLTAPDRAAQVTGWATGLAGDDAGVLRYAALLGERSSVDELASVAESSPAEVLAAIRRLAALGLVDEVDGRVSVRYPLLRDDLVATSAGLRGTVARALASRDAAPEDVAAHLVHAPLDSRVVNWLAEHAERLAAEHPLLVVDLLTRAVDRLPPGHPERHRIGASLAEAQLWSGRTEQARRSAGAGLVVRPDEQVRHRLRAVLAKIAIGEFDGAGAIEILDAEREEGKLPARLAVLDGLARFLIADLDGMQRAAEQAAPAAPHDPIVELSLLNFEAIALSFQRDFTGALAALDRAEALLSVAEDPLQRGWALFVRVVALDITQDIRVLDVLERGRPLAERVGMGMLPLLRTGAAVIAYNFGRWDDSLAEIRAAAELPDLYGLGGPSSTPSLL
ncbi:hypothetical protein REH65_11750 [Saccharopolyspora sp. ID03-671]|uniref:hypothetical protein n=1 Tax=Saccharopolyspora sp. ID03-671 TaxID=3073066 RepID=UPI003253BD5B